VELDQLDPKDRTQRNAFAAFMAHKNGLLNVKCGGGKTTIALHAIAQLSSNALIIVNQGTILIQWRKAIERFLKFTGGIGSIKGNPSTWDWKHPITIATLQSLAMYADDVSIEMRRWFGVIIWDECHHLSAPYFSTTAYMFPGSRYGLSATVRREDGTEVVYNYHIGETFYKDLMQTVKPVIEFRQLPTMIPPDDYVEAILDKRGQINISKLRAYVGTMDTRNHRQLEDLKELASMGRKILALSHTKDHLYTLRDLLRLEHVDCGMCTGDDELKRRWDSLREKQVVLGTHQLVLEAIDEKSLDTLVWLTPFGSQHPEGGKNALQQGMGRIQGYRYSKGMNKPRVIIYDDVYIKHLHRMCQQLKKQLKRWPPDEGGPYEYKLVNLY
jgi:superfamily II DNA or RNA helicase